MENTNNQIVIYATQQSNETTSVAEGNENIKNIYEEVKFTDIFNNNVSFSQLKASYYE